MLCAELAKKHGFRIQNLGAPKVLSLDPKTIPQDSQRVVAESAYDLHRRDILSKLSVKNPSQLDWMIAVRMRVTGHSQENILSELKITPKARDPTKPETGLSTRRGPPVRFSDVVETAR